MLKISLLVFICLLCFSNSCLAAPLERWSAEKANKWGGENFPLIGSNYNPANSVNELEMWQAETFDPAQIDKELGWAEGIGMNTMRVFLHDLLCQQDADGFKKRLNTFLTIASKHHIKPMLVLFDSCWDPHPFLGPQHPPVPGVHNSAWVQSPGAQALADEKQYPRLKQYVQGVVSAFASDPRILAWDVWNEPNNRNAEAYGRVELANKEQLVANLLPQVYQWVRECNPAQPLTSGLWDGEWTDVLKLTSIQKTQLDQSDLISFHNYGWPEDFERRVIALETYHRPLICTEFMARGAGSTFDTILPIARTHHVGVINWGLVAGKTQTNLPWDSWAKPYVLMPPTIWFHEVFWGDGKPYREQEVKLIKDFARR